MNPVEFRFQPFEGKLKPSQFLAKGAGPSRWLGTAFRPWLKTIIHRGQAERAVEPIGPAQDRPNGLAGKGEVMLAFKANHLQIRNPKSEIRNKFEQGKNQRWKNRD
jgi:hypothetical protein